MATDAGTVTILFTDIAGSTELMDALGDQAAERARREHFAQLREILGSHGGREVKTLGDGIMAVFPSATDALDSAVAIQREMARQNEGRADGRQLLVRIGVHVGEPFREETDYFGRSVVLARRLCDAVEGGRILVSDLVHGLVAHRAEYTFNLVGPVALKGFSEPTTAYDVMWDEGRDGRAAVVGRDVRAGFAVPLPASLAPQTYPLVARTNELARLRKCWDEARNGRLVVAFVDGEPGIGKTRLASDFARSVFEEGATVLYGRCDEEPFTPYQPVVEGIQHYIAACPPAILRRQIGPGAVELGHLLPELSRRLPEVATRASSRAQPFSSDEDVEGQRFRLFEAVRILITEASALRPVLFLMDDLHWATKPTLHLLRHLIRSLGDAPILIIGTYRHTDVAAGHPLEALLARLRRERRCEEVSLTGLDENAVAEFVAVATGESPSRPLAQEIYGWSDGSPFFVEELIRSADPRGLDEGTVKSVRLPRSVRDIIGERLRSLSESCLAGLQAASVIGREVDIDVLGQCCDMRPDELLESLEEAQRRGLVVAPAGDTDRFSFAHSLVRAALYERLPVTRRAALHRKAGGAIERLSGDIEPHLAEVAHHFFMAGSDAKDTAKAVGYARRAADRAASQYAHEEAASLYQLALDALQRVSEPDGATKCELELALGTAWARAGDGLVAAGAFLRAAAAARELDRANLLALAALGFGEVRRSAGVTDPELIGILEEAQRALPPDALAIRARITARLTSATYHATTHQSLMSASERARNLARRAGDMATTLYVLSETLTYRHAIEDVEAHLRDGRELLDLAEQAGDQESALRARRFLAQNLLQIGDIAAADEELRAFAEQAERLRQPYYIWLAMIGRGMRAIMMGQFDEADRLIHSALEAGQETQSHADVAGQLFGVQLFALRREQGRLSELEMLTRDAADRYDAIPSWSVALAYLYSETGQLEKARERFEQIARGGFDLPHDYNWLIGMALLAETCARIGDGERAGELYERLAPFASWQITGGDTAVCAGPVSRLLGALAGSTKDWKRAEDHLSEALRTSEQIGSLPFVARTQLDLGRVLMEEGSDDERAGALLEAARSSASSLGMADIVRRASEALGAR